MLKAICAINKNKALGKEGKMLWRSSEDFKHFKRTTMGGLLIVGRVTFENDFGGKTLPGRECFVIGKGYMSPSQAYTAAVLRKEEKDMLNIQAYEGCPPETNIWVVGGSSIYKLFLPLVDVLHLSNINDDQEGDVHLDLSSFKGEIVTYDFEVNTK